MSSRRASSRPDNRTPISGHGPWSTKTRSRFVTRSPSRIHAARQKAAVDDEDLACDETGGVGREKDGCADQLVELPESAHRRAQPQLLTPRRVEREAIEIGLKHARRDGVHGDAARCPF